jgi:hypothetical protein
MVYVIIKAVEDSTAFNVQENMNFIKKTITATFLLASILVVTQAFAQSDSQFRIFEVFKTLPRFSAQDMEESDESRLPRLMILSSAIEKAAKARRPRGVSERDMQAALMSIAYKETRLAKNVSIGRCDLMPKGQRCDSGKAKTYFQLWKVACPAVYADDLEPGSQGELDIAADCAARLLTYGYNRCAGKNKHGIWPGAFAGYRSIDCQWEGPSHQGPVARTKYMHSISYKLGTISKKEDSKNKNTK